MSSHSFQEVAWQQVYDVLHEVPHLFQLWACKQVMEVAVTTANTAAYTEGRDPHCPSFNQAIETCSHMLHYKEAGHVDALKRSIDWFHDWLKEAGTEPSLRQTLV